MERDNKQGWEEGGKDVVRSTNPKLGEGHEGRRARDKIDETAE